MNEDQKESKIRELLLKIKELEEENKKYKEQKTYGLVWENEKIKEKIVEDCKKKLPILERIREKEIITDKEKPTNIMIEGDNYHALSCLNYTHRNSIDVIYIDPPYNTGKTNEWKYNDKFVDDNDNYKHSKWLNMMETRLKLAKNLLKDNGVIFISIDDHEQANLKLLCDDKKVFGEENFITTLHVEMSTMQGMKVSSAQKGNIVKNCEYILIYSKNGYKNIAQNILYDCKEDYDNHYSIVLDDQLNSYSIKTLLLSDTKLLEEFGINHLKKTKIEELFKNSDIRNFVIKNSNKIYRTNNCDINMSDFNDIDITNKIIKIKKNNKEYIVHKNSKGTLEQFLCLKDTIGQSDDFYKCFGLRKIRGNLWKDYHKDMVNISKEGDTVFENGKKPLRLIKDVIRMSSDKNATVLDFFAGSGTTGQAVLDLNKEDGGNRKFILCTNNEGNIATEVCYPRIEKVIKGYKKNGNGEFVEGLGGNLEYFKADENSFISIDTLKKVNDPKKLELTYKAGELIAIKEDIFNEISKNEYWQIFENDKRQVAIYFTEDQRELRDLLKKLDIKKEKIVYLFNWGKNTASGEDFGYPDILIKDIPQPIINIYQEING